MLAPKYCARFAAQTSDQFFHRVMGTDFACMLWSAGRSLLSLCLSDCALVLCVKNHSILLILSDCAGRCRDAMLPHCLVLILMHDYMTLGSGCVCDKTRIFLCIMSDCVRALLRLCMSDYHSLCMPRYTYLSLSISFFIPFFFYSVFMLLSLSFIVCGFGPEYCYHFVLSFLLLSLPFASSHCGRSRGLLLFAFPCISVLCAFVWFCLCVA